MVKLRSGILLLLLFLTLPLTLGATKLPTSATIVALNTACSGISVTGTGSHNEGIKFVRFNLVDPAKDPLSTLVDWKAIYYNKPLPKQVTETWGSAALLTPGTLYRVAFQVWASSPPYTYALVASDARDFTCS